MIYILAGNAAQAANWCRENNTPLPQARYVQTAMHLRGLEAPDHVVTGTFWDRTDSIDIWKTLVTCFAGSGVPAPEAPPEIEPFLHPTLPSAPVTPAPVKSIPNPTPPFPILDPVKDEEETPKKKGFKKIRK